MTVRTLSGATVTLVGRGANYFDGDKIIPSFVDANGTQYFIINDPDDLAAVPAIVNGLLTINAAAIPPMTIAATNAILVNDPVTVENSTSALVFAKRCGIDVSLEGLLLFDDDIYIYLSNQPLTCIDGVVQLTSKSEDTWAVFADIGNDWSAGPGAYVDCSYQPLSVYEGAYVVGAGLVQLWDQDLSLRRCSHNSWVFHLAGVPGYVFDIG